MNPGNTIVYFAGDVPNTEVEIVASHDSNVSFYTGAGSGHDSGFDSGYG